MVLFGNSSAFDGVIQLIVVLIMFLIVLAMAYFTARFIGKYQGNLQSHNNIHIIETVRISTNKYLQIVEIGGRYFAIGVGKEEITFLTEVQKEDLDLTILENRSQRSFQDVLSRLQKKKDENNTDET